MSKKKESVFMGCRYRLYPTNDQEPLMWECCGASRLVFNLGLAQRRNSYSLLKRSPSFKLQNRDLKELRNDPEYEWLRRVPMQVLQQSLVDLRVAFDRFFTGKAKYPRFKSKYRDDGFRVPQHVQVERVGRHWGRVYLQKLGWVRFRWHRPLGGVVKSATIKYKAGEWHVSLLIDRGVREPKINSNAPVGVDLGVTHAVVTSKGDFHDSESWSGAQRARLKRLERRKARQVKGSSNWARTKLAIAKLHTHAQNKRTDFNHKVSDGLAKSHGTVVVEDLKIRNMTKSAKGTVEEPGKSVAAKATLNRLILETGWGQLVRFIEYKCEREGSQFIEVAPQYTSQTCAKCGRQHEKSRFSQNGFKCVYCGHEDNADLNAAKVIERKGIFSAGGHSASACGGFSNKLACEARTTHQPVRAGTGSPHLKEGEDVTICEVCESDLTIAGDFSCYLNNRCKKSFRGGKPKKRKKRNEEERTLGKDHWDSGSGSGSSDFWGF